LVWSRFKRKVIQSANVFGRLSVCHVQMALFLLSEAARGAFCADFSTDSTKSEDGFAAANKNDIVIHRG
jgi:hypothetical protein